ncbi:beta-lactamase family protein [Pacificimonas sp. WHA3]|uniref:Beta-lactamase family protein n=1 Tax=Pacificimonas pallii TaxID=2827236 RepID=A0ABS6SI06_9SPHN|nr:serine hydrolase domain-containing protein [Pacificimonas pallii]MBV7257551.1 beta-lactamase family protein [Pacificimonas pallii]
MRFVFLGATMLALIGSGCANEPTRAMASGAQNLSAQDAALAARVDTYFAPLVETRDISGTLIVRRGGVTVLTRHLGYADWAKQRPHTPATLYSTASVTKGVTAAVIISLMRDGRLDMDESLGTYMPAMSVYPALTARTVLQHRAGLPREFPDDYDPRSQTTAAWLAADSARVGPGGEEAYSNVGYALLAELAEAVGGQSFEKLAQAQILSRAGLGSAVIQQETAGSLADGAIGYSAGPEPLGVMPSITAPPEAGATGLIMTADDLARWAETLAGNAYPELTENDGALGPVHVGSGDGGRYVSVQGSLPGYTANAVSWMDRDVTIAFAGNLFSYPALDLNNTLIALLSDEAMTPPAKRPGPVAISTDHRALIGIHDTASFGRLRISAAEDGNIFLSMPDKAAHWRFHLTPIEGGVFHWRSFDQLVSRDEKGTLRIAPR